MPRRLLVLLVAAACGDRAAPGADAGPASPDARPPPATTCALDPGLRFDDLGEVLQLASADGATCARLTRRNDCPPDTICKAVPFTILHAELGHGGAVAEQDDPSAMAWHETWHNWTDSADIRIGAACHRLQLVFGDAISYELSAEPCQGDGPSWGPERLLPYPPL